MWRKESGRGRKRRREACRAKIRPRNATREVEPTITARRALADRKRDRGMTGPPLCVVAKSQSKILWCDHDVES